MNDVISQLKNNNKLINIIRCYPQISKAALAEYLKVSWPTVSTNIEVLRKSNILSASPLTDQPGFRAYDWYICWICTDKTYYN